VQQSDCSQSIGENRGSARVAANRRRQFVGVQSAGAKPFEQTYLEGDLDRARLGVTARHPRNRGKIHAFPERLGIGDLQTVNAELPPVLRVCRIGALCLKFNYAARWFN
jgi:hypothetical protein